MSLPWVGMRAIFFRTLAPDDATFRVGWFGIFLLVVFVTLPENEK